MAVLLSSLLLASAAPLKINDIVCITFLSIQAHKHKFSPINQCNWSGEGGHSLRVFKLVCKTHWPRLQCTPKRDFWHAKWFGFPTVYNLLYDITEYFIPNPQHSKTYVRLPQIRNQKSGIKQRFGIHFDHIFLMFLWPLCQNEGIHQLPWFQVKPWELTTLGIRIRI